MAGNQSLVFPWLYKEWHKIEGVHHPSFLFNHWFGLVFVCVHACVCLCVHVPVFVCD